ncbi:MAG: PDZ domain-containing protein [Castellaniella sp.]
MNQNTLLYRLCPADPAGHRFTVQLHIPEPDPDGQEVFLPAWIPGSYLIRDFARQVETLSASANGHPVAVQKLDNHRWRCAPCEGPLEISTVVYAWDLSVRSAHLDESHAFFNGTSVFLGVEGQTDKPCRLQLEAPPHTDRWRVYTSLPADGAAQDGFGDYLAPDYDALVDHPVEMGEPRVIEFLAHGARHRLVFTGCVPNLDLERIAADVQKICEAQMALFEPESPRAAFLDSSECYDFLTMVTQDGYGGLEHRASTALLTARHHLPVRGRDAADPGYQDFLGLVSHEYFHTWNVKRIKPAAFVPYAFTRENFTQLLWVFEGFTSYYDDLMLLRAGVISQDDYLKRLGKVIAGVERGPGRHKQSVAESSFDAWTRFYKQDENSPNALVSYYTKGSLVALGLDLLLRRESGNTRSLDDVMRLMWQRYGRDFYATGHVREGVPEDAMPGLILEATGVDVGDYLDRTAMGREDPPLDALLAGQGIALERKAAAPLPSLDARLQARGNELRLATVYTQGAAHRAGLSAGDVLAAVGGLRITDETGLKRVLAAWQPGDTVDVHVFRRDELRCFRLALAPPPLDDIHWQAPGPDIAAKEGSWPAAVSSSGN